ncbi:MAG: trypsin-like peptidase domain-containing protein [Bacteroidetes bacterium]|nr:trypsin-like peptidase domain-containing protein [Bacteroidota bacterium]
MSMNPRELEQLENYFNQTLAADERAALENRMSGDAEFRRAAEEHFDFLKSLQEYSIQKQLRENLDQIHEEMLTSEVEREEPSRGWLKTLWPSIAVAASVALVSTLATYFTLRYYDNEHQTQYQIVSRKVQKIEKSLDKLKNSNNKKPEVAPGNYSGSGFLVSANGYIVTSYHVIKSADSVFVENDKFGRLKTTLVYGNASSDVAVLLINDDSFKRPVTVPFSVRASEGSIGEPVYTLGYPREEIVYGEGSISAASGFEQNENAYQISIPVNPGNSGGPMIDQQGAVVGIINGVQTSVRGTAFAIKSEVLLNELKNIPADSLSKPLRLNNQSQLYGLSRVNQIKKLKDFVFIVKVYNSK